MSNTVNNYTETDLGNISLNPRGEYDNSAAYEYLDTVSYRGGSYFCLAELETTITGIAPDAGRNSKHWQMIAAPGDMTPEYTAAYNDVINKAVQVETSRAAVELAQQEIEAVQTDVQQLHSDTVQTAQEAENSKNSAANSAQSAEQSRKTVSESEQNINGQIAGFDSRVSEAVEQSKEEINTTKQQAINTITNQQTTSVNTVKTEGEKIITRVGNDAKIVADDRATVEEATQTVLNNAQEVAQNTQTVASNTEKAATSAESAKTSADNATQSAKSVEDASKQIEQNKKDVDSLKEDLDKKEVLAENLVLRNGAANNKGTIKGTSNTVYFECYSLPNTAKQGDIVYSCATFKFDNDTFTRVLARYDTYNGDSESSILANEWNTLSSLGIVKEDKNRINSGYYLYFDDGTTNKTVEFKDFIVLNLTTIFGKGNEPSKETIDKLLSVYENRCFDGIYGSIFNGNIAFIKPRNLDGIKGNYVETDIDGNVIISSVPNYTWNDWNEIGNYGQENKGSIPIYNKVHGTLETDGMFSVVPIWGCWSEKSAAAGTGSKYHGGHVFHGWTTDRKHRLTMLQNIYRDDEAAIFNYIPGDKANNGEGTFLRLRLGADNIGKGVLIEPVLDSGNHYAYTRCAILGRLNIQSDKSKYDVNGDGKSAYTKGLPVNTIPSSSTSDGIKGDFTFDSNYAYFCVDDNKWKRIPLEEW